MSRRDRRPGDLATQAELLDQRLIAIEVLALEVVEESSTLSDKLQQSATRMVILGVDLEVICQIRDALTENGHLYFWRTSIVAVRLIRVDELRLLFLGQHHV